MRCARELSADMNESSSPPMLKRHQRGRGSDIHGVRGGDLGIEGMSTTIYAPLGSTSPAALRLKLRYIYLSAHRVAHLPVRVGAHRSLRS